MLSLILLVNSGLVCCISFNLVEFCSALQILVGNSLEEMSIVEIGGNQITIHMLFAFAFQKCFQRGESKIGA